MLAAFGLVVRHFGEDGAWAIQESRMSSDANLAIVNEPCKSDWFQILKASRQALQPAKLSLAAGGLILTFLLGAALDQVWLGMGWGLGPEEVQTCPLILDADSADEADPRGIFDVFREHQKHCLDQSLKAARQLRLTEGMGAMWSVLGQSSRASRVVTTGDGYGVIAFGLAMGRGVHWLITQQPLYSIIFGTLVLAIWSLFGGAICRVSAMQFGTDRQITAGDALGFARDKFGALFAAPLAPILIVLFIGFCMLIGGWGMRLIPFVGPIVGSIFFGVAMLGGAVIAILVILGAAGFSLMWPAAAVEGLDFLDAISRSLGYVYERMERTALYALLALFYGGLAWLVVRLFALVLVSSTHWFVSAAYPPLEQMWAQPSYDQLFAEPADAAEISDWGARYVAFPLIKTWAAIGGFFLYGYLISFYFTGSTIIYLLLRLRVDDTEWDDIYSESPPDSISAPPEGP